jgi:hypothetical protein
MMTHGTHYMHTCMIETGYEWVCIKTVTLYTRAIITEQYRRYVRYLYRYEYIHHLIMI